MEFLKAGQIKPGMFLTVKSIKGGEDRSYRGEVFFAVSVCGSYVATVGFWVHKDKVSRTIFDTDYYNLVELTEEFAIAAIGAPACAELMSYCA